MGHFERLSNRGIDKDSSGAVEWRRRKIGRFHQLGHGRPGADPVTPRRILGVSLGETIAFAIVSCGWRKSSGENGKSAHCEQVDEGKKSHNECFEVRAYQKSTSRG